MTSVIRLIQGLGRWRISPNRFQPYRHTLPDRYPWLFSFARETLGDSPEHHLLSFGCSVGDEVFALRRYFPMAAIKGIDIDPRNAAEGRHRARCLGCMDIEFAAGDSTVREPAQSYSAIFCCAVLCNGDLTVSGAERCDPILRFSTFERMVEEFARCLRPGGLLCLVSTNFRFCDTRVAATFDVALIADAALLGPDVLFDRDNRLMAGMRYTEVAFRKH